MAEQIILDPVEEANNRAQLDITSWVKWDGVDWGDGAIEAYMADQTYGAMPVDYRIPNRQIQVPLVLKSVSTTSFDEIRTAIQAKVSRFQQEGGWLKRVTSNGGTLYADIVSASVTLPGGPHQATRDFDPDASLTLEVIPDFYGAEKTLPDHTETTAAELIFVERPTPGGIDPANLEFWIRPEDFPAPGTVVTGGVIDSSGNNVAVTASGTSTVVPGVLDGYPGIYSSAGLLAFSLAARTARTIHLLLKQDAGAAANTKAFFGASTNCLNTNAGQYQYQTNQAGGTQGSLGSTTQWALITIRVNSASSVDIFYNGQTPAVASFDPNDAVTTDTTWGLLANTVVSEFFTGYLVEAVFVNIAQGTAGRDAVWGYFADKYPSAAISNGGAAQTVGLGVDGNYPARCRFVIDEDQGLNQLGLIWGFRSRNYDPSATAALAYEAEALNPVSPARAVALTGASGGTVVQHGTISTAWTPIVNTNIGGTATWMSHIGNYRLWVRGQQTGGSASVDLRFVYDVGDMVAPEENPPYTFQGGGTSFFLCDLGMVRLEPTTGTHRWQGQIQGRGTLGTESVSIDRLWFQPVDEFAGVCRGASTPTQSALTGFSGWDAFRQSAGAGGSAVVGGTAPVGGVWIGAGDAVRFRQDASGQPAGYAYRTQNGDADVYQGAYALSGAAAMTNMVAKVDHMRFGNLGAANDILRQGVIVRYADVNNWLMAVVEIKNPAQYTVRVIKRVAGTPTEIGFWVGSSQIAYPNISYSIQLMVDTSGNFWVWRGLQYGQLGDPILTGTDSVLATGGALASGTGGFYDAFVSATSSVARYYGNSQLWVPSFDPVIWAGQSAQLTTQGNFREDASGQAYGPITWGEGDLPRLPVSGLEGRPVQAFVKLSRGDLESVPDTSITDLSGQLFYRPCWITVPE